MNTRLIFGILLTVMLTACGGATSASEGTPSVGTPGTPGTPGGGSVAAEPWKVKGRVVDTAGRPLGNALIWIQPALTPGVVKVNTDAQGKYTAPLLPNIDMPYRAYAWHTVKYREKTFCVRLAATSDDQYEHFTPSAGVIRDFRWQLSGRMPDALTEDSYFGAEVRLFHHTWSSDQEIAASDSTVEVTLVPDGPLIDGSAGRTLVKSARVGENFLYDIPVGRYEVSAVEVHADGTRTPLVVGEYAGPPTAKGTLEFKPQSGCGGAGTNNGYERAFLYVARPAR